MTVPELTVIPKKRIWAGYQTGELAATIEQYRPDILVLRPFQIMTMRLR
jgi:hypothetical protein